MRHPGASCRYTFDFSRRDGLGLARYRDETFVNYADNHSGQFTAEKIAEVTKRVLFRRGRGKIDICGKAPLTDWAVVQGG